MLEVLEPYTRTADPLDHGSIAIDGATAALLLEETASREQRVVDPHHVGNLADVMVRRDWRPMSQLTFLRRSTEPGVLTLVDGRHRLRAQASLPADLPAQQWSVRVLTDVDPRIL